MALRSYSCKGCRNICTLIQTNGEPATYCRTIYDQPENRGCHWVERDGDLVLECWDYTTDPEAEAKEVRLWMEPQYEHKVYDENGYEEIMEGYTSDGTPIIGRGQKYAPKRGRRKEMAKQ